jgi:hypothetical protein
MIIGLVGETETDNWTISDFHSREFLTDESILGILDFASLSSIPEIGNPNALRVFPFRDSRFFPAL